MNKTNRFFIATLAMLFSTGLFAEDIIHDAEHYQLLAQNGEKWAKDDQVIEQKLEAVRAANGGKHPNIVYILLDDVGFGEIGMDELSVIRGYKTPHMSEFAKQGLSLQRMYTEPSCTPTRVAFMTGRYPSRTGTTEAKATIAGDGLAAEEVTLAEVLLEAGYYTSHVGKWHLGDIAEAYPHNQGFIHAEHPIHQQGQLAIMGKDMELADIIRGVSPEAEAQTFTLDNLFVPNPAHMVAGVELRDDGLLYEIDLEPGESWTQAKYREMNERYQRNTISQLRELAAQDKPFFLNYWPLVPINFVQEGLEEFRNLNGGTMANSIVEVDKWIGDILTEIDNLGIADNTIVIVMGDNGPFMQYVGGSGQSDRIYRGGKTDTLEGGVRTNAWLRWPAAVEAGTFAEDIVHVTDLYTTLARVAGATDYIPRDRVVDGVDQTGILLLGETHGRRDYVHLYDGPNIKALVKNKYKIHLPPPGTNPIAAPIYDVYRDSREERPIDSIKYGPWAGGQFVSMLKRHLGMKMKYPDREPKQDIPYGGIANLRPESQALLAPFIAAAEAKKQQ